MLRPRVTQLPLSGQCGCPTVEAWKPLDQMSQGGSVPDTAWMMGLQIQVLPHHARAVMVADQSCWLVSQARVKDTGRKIGGQYPFAQLSTQGGISAVCCDLVDDGESGFWSAGLSTIPTKVKDNFKSLPFDTVTAGPARVMILDELLVAFKTEYEAGNLESFISCMSKSTFSLPWPACSDAIWGSALAYQKGADPNPNDNPNPNPST